MSDLTLLHSTYASPLGVLALSHTSSGKLVRLNYLTPDFHTSAATPTHLTTALDDYFAGDFDAIHTINILWSGTAFQQQVWQATQQIRAGQPISYIELAQQIGRPRAYRAVGQALKNNPIAIVVPCHRVIRHDGHLGGYAGKSEVGDLRKQFLLWHEGYVSPSAHQKTTKLPLSCLV